MTRRPKVNIGATDTHSDDLHVLHLKAELNIKVYFLTSDLCIHIEILVYLLSFFKCLILHHNRLES